MSGPSFERQDGVGQAPSMLQALHGLLSIPSVTSGPEGGHPFGPHSAQALDYVLRLCQSLGFRTQNCQGKVGWAEIGQGEDLAAALVHLDVVPAGEGWDYPPFALTQANGRLYGRGVVDDKGPAIACIYAMKDLLDSGAPLARRIRIIFGLAEEGGDWSDMEHYRQTQQAPVFGFTPDGMFPAIYGEKGFATYQLSLPLASSGVEHLEGGQAENVGADRCFAQVNGQRVEARGRSCHGSKPWEGDNAISKLMEQLSGLPVADWYNRCIGRDLYGERLGCACQDNQLGQLTVNVGKVRTLEDRIVFWLDIRYPACTTAEDILSQIQASAAPFGVDTMLEYYQKPVYMEQDGPLITALMDAYRQVTGDSTAQPMRLGGGTYAKAMEHIAAFGPMLPGREPTEHRPNESIALEDFLLLREIYRQAILRLAQLPSPY